MKVAIVGSRDYPDMDAVKRYVAELPEGTVVISGGAHGVDRIAETAARRRGLEVVSFPADWDAHGRSAGMIRNAKIAKECDRLVAFHWNDSKGTANTILRARNFGKEVEVIKPPKRV